jgi:hypothetical protein
MPRFAETSANGIIILRMSMAPWEKGSKMGRRRETLSRLKEEMEAMLPVLKNADCKRTKKKRATRASWRVSGRKGEARVALVLRRVCSLVAADLFADDDDVSAAPLVDEEGAGLDCEYL